LLSKLIYLIFCNFQLLVLVVNFVKQYHTVFFLLFQLGFYRSQSRFQISEDFFISFMFYICYWHSFDAVLIIFCIWNFSSHKTRNLGRIFNWEKTSARLSPWFFSTLPYFAFWTSSGFIYVWEFSLQTVWRLLHNHVKFACSHAEFVCFEFYYFFQLRRSFRSFWRCVSLRCESPRDRLFSFYGRSRSRLRFFFLKMLLPSWPFT